jgi:hypothetical protein
MQMRRPCKVKPLTGRKCPEERRKIGMFRWGTGQGLEGECTTPRRRVKKFLDISLLPKSDQ